MNKKLDDEQIILGLGGGKGAAQEQRYPVEDPEGINSTLFPRDIEQGKGKKGEGTPGEVSLSKIDVLDIISEGRISGLVDGVYDFEGTKGSIGYDTVTFTPFPNAPNTSTNWLRSAFWNDVPVVNSKNEFNFSEVTVAFTPGIPNGSTIGQVNTELSYSRNIGERLRYGNDFIKHYRLLNKDIKSIEVNIKVNQLSKTNINPEEYGDTEETEVTYIIYYRPIYLGGFRNPKSFKNVTEKIRGKISAGYIRNTRINLFNAGEAIGATDFIGWEVNIERTTPDSITNEVRNQTYVDSITEIYGDVYTYPNTAIFSARFSAEYFSQVPGRSYEVFGLRCSIPDNYDAITKQYTDIDDWAGDYKDVKEWTDNPAWCYNELLSNKRWGLGKYITAGEIDKWTLYEISKYCDTMVSDGYGGVEPRFTCNLLINTKEDAYKIINDMASTFHAITYYGFGSIFAVQDSSKTPIYQFTNANVEDGNFNYSSSSRKFRHTIAIVRYNDKNNFYQPSVEYIEDIEGIRKYGIRELEFSAFGCTSRGQANRAGRWALLSETLQTETISFTAGLEGYYIRPGDIFQVYDNNRKTRRLAGRINRIYDSGHFLLDSELSGLKPGSDNLYYFSVLTPTYNYEPNNVSDLTAGDYDEIRKTQLQKTTFLATNTFNVTGDDGIGRTDLTLPTAFSPPTPNNYILTGNLIWMIEASGQTDPIYNQWEQYRAITIEEKDNYKFNIVGLQYNTGKYNLIDEGLDFRDPSASIVPDGPSNLQLTVESISENSKRIDYSFQPPSDTSIINGYLVYVKFGSDFDSDDTDDDTYLVDNLPKIQTSSSYFPSNNGVYYFRVYSFNRAGVRSITYAFKHENVQGIDRLLDVSISSLRLAEDGDSNDAGTRTDSIATFASPRFQWQIGVADGGIIPEHISYRLTVREPSTDNTPSSNIYFETGNILSGQFDNLIFQWNFHDNFTSQSRDGLGGPFRNYDVVVEAIQITSNTSAIANAGNSSAGGEYILGGIDSNFSNPNGYDILGVTNPPITDFNLTDGEIGFQPGDSYNTDQWITTDGDIKIKIIDGEIPNDLAGAYLYQSNEKFTREEALGLVSTSKTINVYQLTENDFSFDPDVGLGNSPIIISAGLTNVKQTYIGMSLYDLFDDAKLSKDIEIEKDLQLSNIIKITQRGGFTQGNSLFHAWIQITLDFRSQNISDWNLTSNGISSIDIISTSSSTFIHDFYFTTPLSSTNYVIFTDFRLQPDGSNYSFNNADEIDFDLFGIGSNQKINPQIQKFTNKFRLLGGRGTFFFAVLSNQKED